MSSGDKENYQKPGSKHDLANASDFRVRGQDEYEKSYDAHKKSND